MAAMETSFTRLIGCRLPLQQAGMGGVATPALAVAVAEAGGLGMLAMPTAPVAAVADTLRSVQAQTTAPIGINFLMPFVNRDAVAVAAAEARVVEFFYGPPDPSLVALVHDGGALAGWQVGSLDEARAAVDAGCDLVVAQGVEAGGHVRGEVGLLALLDQIVEVAAVPVVAAGGIATARSVAAVLAAGAAAARVGTRFVVADEADTHPSYADALITAGPEDTVLTTTFSVMWPDAPHRVLRSCVDAAAALVDDVVGEMEVAPGIRVPVGRLMPPAPGRATTGRVDAMALYAGQSVGSVHRRQPARDIVAELTADL